MKIGIIGFILGESYAVASMMLLIIFWGIITYNYFTDGVFQITIDSNIFGEHFVELGIFIVGLICYVYYHYFWVKSIVKVGEDG